MKNPTEEQIGLVVKKITETGLRVNVSCGTERTVIGAIGDERKLDHEMFGKNGDRLRLFGFCYGDNSADSGSIALRGRPDRPGTARLPMIAATSFAKRALPSAKFPLVDLRI